MASGIISLGTSGALTGQLVWSSTSNGTAANSSNVTASIQIKRTNSYTTTGTFDYGINVGGKIVHPSWYGSISNSWITIATLSNTVSHNNDGTGSCYLEAYVNGPSDTSLSGNTVAAKQTVTLDTIPRQANLTSAPNFNDEQSPAITYSNPAGNSVTTLRACIANDAMNNTYANWRDISKTGNSYTFNLTDTERNALRNAIPNSNTLTVRFMIETNIGGVLYYSNIPRTLTIVNGNPVLSPTIKDVGTGSLALTGDANKIIKGFNYIEYTSGASAKKGASIVSQKVVCGSKTATNGNGSFTDVDSASFVFSVTDSRGNTITQTINKTLIDYVKLTCNIGDKKPDVNGNMKVECSGNYFNGSFGAVANTLNVQYRYKVQGGEYSDWTNMTITKDGNTYTAEAYLTGLNYQTTYVFQTKAVDKISWEGVLSEEIIVRSYPVFDWGKNDFRFNVDAHGWFSSDVKDLPDGDGDRVYWRDLKAGTYWYALDRMNIGEMPDLFGFVEKKGYIGADYSVMFYTQPEGAIFRRSGNIHNDSGWVSINPAKVLYENSSGSNGTITLNDNLSNYSKIEIYWRSEYNNDWYTHTFIRPNGRTTNLSYVEVSKTDIMEEFYVFGRRIFCIDNTISTYDNQFGLTNFETAVHKQNRFYIAKVIGYR